MSNNSSLSKAALWLMTVATGLTVANIYYCQPLLGQMQESFSATEVEIGWIPTLVQLGYGLGMLLLVPLGDQFERRFLMVSSTWISGIALLCFAFTNNVWIASFFSFAIGLATMTPQYIIPYVAHMAQPEKRGQIVGTVMSGLLFGILLARTVAGFLGAEYGWRAMFVVASVMMLVLGLLLMKMLPTSEPSFKGSYLGLLKSVFHYIGSEKVLRESMIFGGMLFAGFSAFWASLIHLLESDSFHLGARTVGIFGLLGAVGALAAPVVGRIADRGQPRKAIGMGIVLTALSFGIYWVWGSYSLLALGLGVLVMDVGMQGVHVTNQSRVFALVPEARSRLNTAYMFAYFMGGSAGSFASAWAWSHFGWAGVCAVSLMFIAVAAFVYLFGLRRSPISRLAN